MLTGNQSVSVFTAVQILEGGLPHHCPRGREVLISRNGKLDC